MGEGALGRAGALHLKPRRGERRVGANVGGAGLGRRFRLPGKRERAVGGEEGDGADKVAPPVGGRERGMVSWASAQERRGGERGVGPCRPKTREEGKG